MMDKGFKHTRALFSAQTFKVTAVSMGKDEYSAIHILIAYRGLMSSII